MQRRMCWLAMSDGDSQKILHLQTKPHEPWRPYTAFPEFAVPDYQMPGASKGLATFQKLLKEGWIVMPSH